MVTQMCLSTRRRLFFHQSHSPSSTITDITLRQAFRHVMNTHSFTIDTIVILAGYRHCLWQLLKNDVDFSTR